MDEKKLDIGFWDDIWSEASFERYYGIEKYLVMYKKWDSLFKRYLPKGDLNVLELGCAQSKQLIYFAKEFGYRVSGLDYSERGVALSKANLRIAKVKGDIRHENMFQASFPDNYFDVVYSNGLLEHFADLESALDVHIKLLKSGGIAIVIVPNFRNSLSLDLTRLNRRKQSILATHNLEAMNRKVFASYAYKRSVGILFLNYFGCIDLTLPLGNTKHKPLLYLLELANQVVGYLTYFMPSSRYFSPYLAVILRKGD